MKYTRGQLDELERLGFIDRSSGRSFRRISCLKCGARWVTLTDEGRAGTVRDRGAAVAHVYDVHAGTLAIARERDAAPQPSEST